MSQGVRWERLPEAPVARGTRLRDNAQAGRAHWCHSSSQHRRVTWSVRMDPKLVAQQQIAQEYERLVALSHRMYADPEIAWEEERACGWLAGMLADAGFAVQTGVYDLPTAFVARMGSGPLHIAICAEYDALPDIGHACGHNIIAASSLGAALALAKVADDLGLTISVIGTPAEEVLDSGGKILLLERGAFAGVHAA